MRFRLVLPLLALVVAACSSGGGTEVAGACTVSVRVGDIGYAGFGEVSADRVGPEITRTLRQRDCDDVRIFGEPEPEGWKSGDSSFDPGTPVYTSLDYPIDKAVVVHWGGRYLLLHTLPHPGSLANP